MTNQSFRTRAATSGDFDFDKGVKYRGAMMGVITPGEIAVEVLGQETNFGRLFAYCFRRFGFPNTGADPYKEIAEYRLITPMRGVFLDVSLKAHTDTSLLFGYVMPRDLDFELAAEERASNEAFHAAFLAWRHAKGLLLPRDKGDKYDYREDSAAFYSALEQYCADGGTHYGAMPKGPKTEAVLDAIRVTLEDLKTPVGVRDCLFSAVSDSCDFPESADGDDDEDPDKEPDGVADRHPSAGYFIPTELVADPKMYVALIERLESLGDGNLATGITKFIGHAEATA